MTRAARRDERGSMAVEVVVLMPVLVMFALLVVAGGRYVAAKGDMEAAARDGARAASLERTYTAAVSAAETAVDNSLDGSADCDIREVDNDFRSSGSVTIELDCRVSQRGLGLIGLNGDFEMAVTATAPVDTYRRTG